jgi:hypothetical protein
MHAVGIGAVPLSPAVSNLLQGVSAAMKTAMLKLLFGIAAAFCALTLTGIATADALSGPAATPEKPAAPRSSVEPPAAPREKSNEKKLVDDKKEVDRRIAVRFERATWQEVLDWYSKESGLILNTTVRPAGTVTIKPPGVDRTFTLAEVTDLINECLAIQKFMLIRNTTTFTIRPIGERIDGDQLPAISQKDLKTRGKTELVRCVIGPFRRVPLADIRPELEAMLTPVGKLQVLERSNSLQISDRAGNILRIMELLDGIENAPPKQDLDPTDFPNVRLMTRHRVCRVCSLLNRWHSHR